MRLASLFASFASMFWLAAQTAQNPLPNSGLKDPDGQKVGFRFTTVPNSFQIYTCKQTAGSFSWAGPDPDAMLVDSTAKLTVHHYKGPTWEASDGSIVRSEGALARHYLANRPNAVHWLELPAKDASGQFAKVTFIHRIDTTGGIAPTSGCDAQHNDDQEKVKYSATYLFYVPR